MLVTLSGIVTLVKLPQLLKAKGPMAVTGFPLYLDGITNSPLALVSQSVMVTLLPSAK
jgi:hypothetical protein